MRKGWKLARLALLLTLLLALACTGALAAEYGAKVLKPEMKVYSSRSTDSKLLFTLSQKTAFKVLSFGGDWALISTGDSVGYAQMGDIIFDKGVKATLKQDTEFKFVTRSSYRAGKYYIAKAPKGAELYVVGFDGSKALVCNEDRSAIGYISSSAIGKK